MIKLKKEPRCPHLPARCETTAWGEAEPFIVAPRARLVHRVRSITSYAWPDRGHVSVTCWCGYCFNLRPEQVADALVANPPENRLMCEHCEWMAAKWRQPPTDELAGRHVHRGRLVPVRTCCQGG